MPVHETGYGLKPSVEIQRSQNSFERVGQERRLFSSPAALFAASQTQVEAKIDGGRNRCHVLAADEAGAKPCPLPFAHLRKPAIKRFRNHQAENRVSKKFQPLVVRRRSARFSTGYFLRLLMYQGAMRERMDQQLVLTERMSEPVFKRVERLLCHSRHPRASAS